MAQLYDEFNRALYRKIQLGGVDVFEPIESTGTEADSYTIDLSSPIDPSQITTGKIVGDLNVSGGFIQSENFVTGSAGWQLTAEGNLEANAGTFRGSLTANTLDIPDTTSANSFHVDANGNHWSGATTFAAAPFRVSNAGALTATSATISGYQADITATAGETLSQADALGPGVLYEVGAINAVGSLAMGDASARTRIGQSFQFTPATRVVGVRFTLRKVSAPTDTLTIALQADSSGAPSGSDLTTVSIGGGSLTTSFVGYQIKFSPQALVAATSIWLVLYRSGAVDVTNYYQVEGDNSNQYSGGTAATYNGTTWSNSANDIDFFAYAFESDSRVGRLYTPVLFLREYFLGFANAAAADGATVTINATGAPSIFTSLTPFENYYISTSSAGAISTTVPSLPTFLPSDITIDNYQKPVLRTLTATRGVISI